MRRCIVSPGKGVGAVVGACILTARAVLFGLGVRMLGLVAPFSAHALKTLSCGNLPMQLLKYLQGCSGCGSWGLADAGFRFSHAFVNASGNSWQSLFVSLHCWSGLFLAGIGCK